MSKFCSKCGKELADGVMFCSSCGNGDESQPILGADSTSPDFKSVKKFNPLKIIIPVVAVVLVVAIGLGIVFFRGGNSVVTKNKQGELVFATTFDEYIDLYNEKNSELLDMTLSADEFEFVEYEGTKFYKKGASVLYVDDENHVKRICIMPYSEDGNIIYAIEYFLDALYPELNEGEIDYLLKEAFYAVEDTYDKSSVTYEDVKIEYTCLGENNTVQQWDLVPNEK